jgi:ribose transport system substrate-binding protein
MTRSKVFAALLLLGVGFLFVSPQATAQDVTIAYVTNGPYTFWTYAHAGCLTAEKELGVKVEFYKPPSAQLEEQKRFIETMLAKGIKGIAISVIDPDNMTPFMNEVAAQVPLVMFDSDAPKSNRSAYIGMSNYAAGRMAGKAIKEQLPDGGKFVVFVGRLDAQNAVERRQGIIDELQGKPYADQYPGEMTPAGTDIQCDKWLLLDTRTDGGDESHAKANAEDSLVKYPDLDLMIGLWSYNTPAIITAVKDAGKFGKIKIIGFDEEEVVLQAIKDGNVAGTIVQNPYEYGRKSIEVLANLINKKDAGIPASKLVDVPARYIVKDVSQTQMSPAVTVDEFWSTIKKQLEAGEAAEKK